jgi:signal transduction histidine kinase
MSNPGPLQPSPAQPTLQVALALGQSLATSTTVDDVIQQMLIALVEMTGVEFGAVYMAPNKADDDGRATIYSAGDVQVLGYVAHDNPVQQAQATGTVQQVERPDGVQANYPIMQDQTVFGVAQLLFPDLDTCDSYQHAVGVVLRFGAVAIVNAKRLEQLRTRLSVLERIKAAHDEPLEKVRLLAMSELATAVAHQLNNPLTTILVETEMVLTDHTPDDSLYTSLIAIYRAGRRAADVAHRLMSVSYSDHRRSARQTVHVAASIWETISVLQSALDAENIKVWTQFSEGVPPLAVEPTMLEDVWLNLLMNAKDELSRHHGGKIGLELKLVDDMEIEVIVWDTGSGVETADYEQIFEPFFTRKSKVERTGLGLYISRQIVRDLGGELSVGQHEQGGAQFTVRLPIKRG